MKETAIERQFFKFYELGGLVDRCIDYVQRKYDWGFKYDSTQETKLSETAGKLYHVELPALIFPQYEANKFWFDDMVARQTSPLIDEIESNLNECKTDVERDKYIFSLITPFARLGRIIHPTAEIESLKARISENEKTVEIWNEANPDEQAKKQLEACRDEIARLNWQVERTKEVSRQFGNLLCCNVFENGTVENCLCAMYGTMITYSNRLFAMLIQQGINLKEYQKKAGVYLKENWSVTDIDSYVGSMELAKHYLYRLNDEQNTPAPLLNDKQHAPRSTNKQQDNSHFNATYTKDQLTTIFDRLIDGRYLHPDSVLDDWLIMCGAETSNEPTKQLNWMKVQNLLGWLVYSMFQNDDTNYWAITEKVFTVKGKTPNTNSMKTDVSKIASGDKDKPKSFEELEELLKV